MPSETGKDVETIYSDSAKMKVKISAPLFQHYIKEDKDTSYSLFRKGIHVIFYDDSFKVKTELTARYAKKFDNINIMEARNDVVLVNRKGEKLNTERLTYDGTRRLIYTNAFVKITTKDEIIFGDGLESNADFSKYKIIKPTGTISSDQ